MAALPKQSQNRLVVHVSADFPDPVEPDKTQVIRTLLDMTGDRFDHRVFSLNRQSLDLRSASAPLFSGKRSKVDAEFFDYGFAVRYSAPPLGIMHRTMLLKLGDWLASQISLWPTLPDLLIAHKLSIEGIAVQRAASRLGIPFGISIQGDTDTKVLAARPDLAGTFRSIVQEAKVVFPFAPWAWKAVREALATDNPCVVMLPCPTDLDEPLQPRKGGQGPLTAFHLRNYRRKNLAELARAMAYLPRDHACRQLTVLGGGDKRTVEKCRRVVGDAPVVLAGEADRQSVRQKMNEATVFVLPSLRESFGLVFIEALFAGLPIIYPRGAAVEGYFDDAPFALAVDARDHRSIASAISAAITHEDEMKSALAEWQDSNRALSFRRPAIGRAFERGLRLALAGDTKMEQSD